MDDIDYISDEALKVKHNKTAPKRNKIRVLGGVEAARNDYRNAKRLHKAQIKQVRSKIAISKLAIKQAAIRYKMVKLANSNKPRWPFLRKK